MPWRFVGRTEQIERIQAALEDREPGPVVITSGPGAGRTAMLLRALEHIDDERDAIIRVEPAGEAPFVALRPYLPADFPAHAAQPDSVCDAARALTEHCGGRRTVIVVDDAHLLDHASMLALRTLSRRDDVFLLATRLNIDGPVRRPDPTDSLRYEPGFQALFLPPLTVDEVAVVLVGVFGGQVHTATTQALHSATGGNPRLLYDLVVRDRLVECMVQRDGGWRLGEPPYREAPDAAYIAERVVEAARCAWRELAVDRTDELCRLALWRGGGEQVAAVWANVLLLRGRAGEALRFLDALTGSSAPENPQLALVRAMSLAFGFGRAVAAGDFLLREAFLSGAGRDTGLRDRLLAYRAWILAMFGRTTEAAQATEDINRSDRETALFVYAARGAVAFAVGRADEAVVHLRRALATAAGRRTAVPWMPPFLTACLIDALLLAGRIREATASARNFHGSEPGSGWEIAVVLAALTTGRRPQRAAGSEVRVA